MEYRRLIQKTSNVASEVPTVPASNDHTDGSWSATDIYKGELFWNSVDQKLYTRGDSGIILLLDNQLLLETTEKTGSHTLVLADAGSVIPFNSASSVNLTIPPAESVNFPVGTQIIVANDGAGVVSIVLGSGVTTKGMTGSELATETQGSLVKTGTNEWRKMGDWR